jgi:hypothetical protein
MLTDPLALFPDLLKDGYSRTSPPTVQYNCIAWALKDDEKWWEPDQLGWFYWPEACERSYHLRSFLKMLSINGYIKCDDPTHEAGFEKLAIYTDGNQFKHIARQLADGKWTSKLGQADDISHSLNGLIGQGYGRPTIYLKRPFPSDSSPALGPDPLAT